MRFANLRVLMNGRFGNNNFKVGTPTHFGLGPHPLIVTTRGNGNEIRVLIYSWCTTISGWGPNPIHNRQNLISNPVFVACHIGSNEGVQDYSKAKALRRNSSVKDAGFTV